MSKKTIAALILLVMLIAACFFVFMQKKVEPVEVVVPPDVVNSIEKAILSGFKRQFEDVKSVDIETLKLAVRHTYPGNYTRTPGGGNFTLRIGVMWSVLRFLTHESYINGSEELSNEVFDWAMNVTEKNGGVFPPYEAACAGGFFVLGMINHGLPRDHEYIKKMLEQLKGLRVADGGWVVLDFSKAKKPDGTPYDLSSTEVTPTVIAAYLKAGYPMNDSLVQKAIKANEEAILKSAYMKEYYPDYIFGNAESIMLFREVGITNFDAYKKARNELIDFTLAKPDPNNTFLIATSLIALQGVIPETSKPYRNGFSMMMSQYDKNTSLFLGGESPVFGAEFSKMAGNSMVPLLAIKGMGYKNGWYNLGFPENQPCGEITRSGDKVIVKSANQPSIEWTGDDFITIKLGNMTGSGGSYEYTLPAKPFHVVMNCTSYYWVSEWYS
jgi:hypothetical protein